MAKEEKKEKCHHCGSKTHKTHEHKKKVSPKHKALLHKEEKEAGEFDGAKGENEVVCKECGKKGEKCICE